ncbi:MAG: flagellar basal body-associated FliL family protein [Candidatus Dactylopiibacterium sp.]|nr:flagellar basal body-associated FliL family protein [Candidatus Dactylopiibacterium sp.]
MAANQTDTSAAPAKKSKKLVLLIVVIVALLGVIAAGAYLLLAKGEPKGEEHEEQKSSHAQWGKLDPSKPPVFIPFEPLTVNLQPENGEQFLQVVISVRVVDAHVADLLKAYTPQIRHEILSLLAGKKASEITSPEGREDLAEDMREIMNDVLGWEPPRKKAGGAGEHDGAPVVSVFFTQFIVQ